MPRITARLRRARSAITGRFVPLNHASSDPATTITEQIPATPRVLDALHFAHAYLEHGGTEAERAEALEAVHIAINAIHAR